jgi:hypothetical protein
MWGGGGGVSAGSDWERTNHRLSYHAELTINNETSKSSGTCIYFEVVNRE